MFEAVAGIVVGVIAGLKKGKWFDATALVVSLLLISVPTFVVGFVLQYVFGIQLGLFRVTVSGQAPGRSSCSRRSCSRPCRSRTSSV